MSTDTRPLGEAGDTDEQQQSCVKDATHLLIERLNNRREPLMDGKSTWVPDALCREAAAALTSLRAERDAAVAERARMWAECKDLSKQGWSALSDAQLWLDAGQPDDIKEVRDCIYLAQASFADTIIASERRATEAESSLAAEKQRNAELERENSDLLTVIAGKPPFALEQRVAKLTEERDENDRRAGEMLREIEKIRNERDRLIEWRDARPTGTREQRERHMLKRTEAAEAKIESTEARIREIIEQCAKIIEDNQETHSSVVEGVYLSARRSGDRSGLAFAAAIRALADQPGAQTEGGQ